MLALVEIAGQQFEVEPNKCFNVPLMKGNPGDSVELGNILLTKNGDSITVGAPYLSGKVSAKIVEHGKNKTVLVFHKKRRKGHRKLNGFRAKYTRIQITDISL